MNEEAKALEFSSLKNTLNSSKKYRSCEKRLCTWYVIVRLTISRAEQFSRMMTGFW
jgi:hypothetical protein